MRIAITKPLFAWDCLEDSPSLKTIRELLAAIPDGKLLESLRSSRGKGRNDYPVHVLWGVVVLTIALRASGHRSLPGRVAAQQGPAAVDRHRVGREGPFKVEHVAVRGNAGTRAASFAA